MPLVDPRRSSRPVRGRLAAGSRLARGRLAATAPLPRLGLEEAWRSLVLDGGDRRSEDCVLQPPPKVGRDRLKYLRSGIERGGGGQSAPGWSETR